MRRGTRVGQAYVAVTADGSGINKDIADAFDDVDFDQIGDKHGDAYAKRLRAHLEGFDKEFSQTVDRMGNNLSSRLSKAIEGDSALKDGVSKTVAKAFDDGRLNELIQYAGQRAGHTFGTEFDHVVRKEVLDALESAMQRAVRSGSLDMSDLVRGINSGGGQIELLGSIADDAVKRVEAARAKMDREIEQSIQHRVKQERLGETIVNKMHADSAKMWEALLAKREKDDAAYTRYLGAEERNRLAQAARAAAEKMRLDERSAREQSRHAREYEKWWSSALRAVEDDAAKAEKSWQRLGVMQDAALRMNAKFRAGLLDGAGRAVSGNRDQGGLGDSIGGLLGAGSRNNALNLFGKMIGGAISGVESLARTGQKMFSEFQKGWAQAGEGATLFQKLVAGGGAAGSEAFASIAASGPAAAASIGVVIVAMSVLASVASALTAIITALVATIVSGLVGGLLVASAGLAATAAAAGLLVVAFTSLTDAQSKMLSDAFRPLKAELTGLGQLMITQLIPYFDIWSTNLQEALVLAAPVAAVMGQAFGQAGAALTAALSGPGFQRFAEALGVWLPSITQRMSAALGNFLNGLTGVFAALLPLVNRFAGYLENVTKRFSDWANSAAGQNAIVNFADRAVASLESLWNFVREFAGFLADVLFSPQAQDFGNSMFDGLADSFQRLRRKIDSGDLERWFAQARDFGAKLWKVLVALTDTFAALNDSGVLEATADGLMLFADAISIMNGGLELAVNLLGVEFVNAIAVVTDPVNEISRQVNAVADAIMNVLSAASSLPGINLGGGGGGGSWGGSSSAGTYNPLDHLSGSSGNGLGVLMSNQNPGASYTIPDLTSIGTSALNNTSVKNGGYKQPKEYVNPYKAFAQSLIDEGPTVLQQLRATMRQMTKDALAAVSEASTALSTADAKNALTNQAKSLVAAGADGVDKAQSALNSAANDLLNASSASAAKKALKEVRKAQKDLKVAIKDQKELNKAAKILNAQKSVDLGRVQGLINGAKVQNATLADYARARAFVAEQLEKANQKLVDAIQLRDDYAKQVTDGINSFGALTTASAKTINGVEQALTYGDITDNLQERLDKIKKFQENLRLLLAQGLSQAAYQQIVDAGVEGGSAYAQALVEGGTGAISQTNSLVSQIGSIADSLGIETSNRLYQAGVDAAQGLVDGLTSLSAQLDAAAVKLGTSIANAVKKALGIKSPSTVMIGMMDYVGDGAVIGLDKQSGKVGAASRRFSDNIAVSPEVAAYAASQGASPTVSGNGEKFLWTGDIVTPTEDPHAVATEVMNELTGRL